MSKRTWLAIIAVLVLLTVTVHSLLIFAVDAVVVVVYIASIKFHPRARHGRCGGSGEHHSRLFPWIHRKDPNCQGGRVIRPGARLFGSPQIKAEIARNDRERAARRRNGSWR